MRAVLQKRWFLVGLAVLLCATACSVKEDRADCPCLLSLDLPCPDGLAPADSVRLSLGGALLGASADSVAFGRWEGKVRRRQLTVSAWRGDGGRWQPGRGLSVAPGEAWPPLWSASLSLDCRQDRLSRELVLHRHHAWLTVVLSGGGVTGLVFRSGWCGCGPDGRPLSGDFAVRTVPAADSSRICLPRQGDGSLRLEMLKADKVVRTFAIGHFILEGGYDWQAPDLEDIRIAIDFAATSLTLSSGEWSKTLSMELVI